MDRDEGARRSGGRDERHARRRAALRGGEVGALHAAEAGGERARAPRDPNGAGEGERRCACSWAAPRSSALPLAACEAWVERVVAVPEDKVGEEIDVTLVERRPRRLRRLPRVGDAVDASAAAASHPRPVGNAAGRRLRGGRSGWRWSPSARCVRARHVGSTRGTPQGLARLPRSDARSRAALLSLGYVAFYLRDGPRIVDATSYFLQARALSEGHLAWHIPEPTASFRGRFLFFHDGAALRDLPPGYPLLLSLGFSVGAPLVVGPGLAAAIVIATWMLARELAREASLDAHVEELVARVAAGLSVACAALRYHTADTMAHGACALAFTLAILAALRSRRERLPWFFLLGGARARFRRGDPFRVGARARLGLGLARPQRKGEEDGARRVRDSAPSRVSSSCSHPQSVATGHALRAVQSAYYAASDGPPGCFRYGFGAGIGCLVEHGDFVRARAQRWLRAPLGSRGRPRGGFACTART